MYLRHTTRRKDGKTHVYWQLVRLVRRGRKVLQETVVHLGELDAEGRARAAKLARSITGDGGSGTQGRLFELMPRSMRCRSSWARCPRLVTGSDSSPGRTNATH